MRVAIIGTGFTGKAQARMLAAHDVITYVDDFMPLCKSHHIRYGKQMGFWGYSCEFW
jgi:hypothetical protein